MANDSGLFPLCHRVNERAKSSLQLEQISQLHKVCVLVCFCIGDVDIEREAWEDDGKEIQ